MNCTYCDKECRNLNSLVNHQRCCKLNPNRQSTWLMQHSSEVTRRNMYGKAKALGLPKPTSPRKGQPGTFRGKHHSEATKQQMSEAKKLLYASGWESTAGRCKKIVYTSSIAGEVFLDGTWELAVAKYLDSQGLHWNRNTQRFKYVNLKEKNSTYCPDFYISEWESFLEVKGYETELDRCKWLQFDKKLIVWKKKELQELGIEFLSKGSAKV